MNKEALAKARETRAENRKGFAAQTIAIDDKWQIIRSDEYNWEVQQKNKEGQWKFDGFYGSILAAFDALPDKMLGSVARSDLSTVKSNQKAIRETIEKALRVKLA